MAVTYSASIPMGTPAPSFTLPGTDENTYSLDSFSVEYLVVVFMCNHCPYVIAIEEDLRAMEKKYKSKGVDLIGINSNNAAQYPQDGFEEMKVKDYDFPYLYDESQEVATAYGALCTPDIFVYDKNRALVYHGRFNNAERGETVATTSDLEDALDQLLSQGEVSFEQHPSVGCNIKWKE